MKKLFVLILSTVVLAASVSGCSMRRSDAGLVAGGVVGAAAGAAIARGSPAGTAVGAIGGALIGRELARDPYYDNGYYY